MTSDTAIFCEPLDITALSAVKLSVSIVEADPVMVACIESSCVCMAPVTPSKCPNSVEVTALTYIFPPLLETYALDAVK